MLKRRKAKTDPCRAPFFRRRSLLGLVLAGWYKNGKYEGANRETFRLVMQKLSNFCRATASDAVNILGYFSSREFAATLHHLKLRALTSFVRSL